MEGKKRRGDREGGKRREGDGDGPYDANFWICRWYVLYIRPNFVFYLDKQDNVQANSESVQYCLHLSSFLKYLTCNSDDLELGQFKVIQGQRSWCQSVAQGRFHIRLPLTPSWMQAYKWAKLEVNWCACAFNTPGVTGHRAYFFVRCVTYSAFHICGRSD